MKQLSPGHRATMAVPKLEVRLSHRALLSSAVSSTPDSRGSGWFFQPFLGVEDAADMS